MNQGLLESILDRASRIQDPFTRAGYLLLEISTLHPFLNGNKRAGFMAAALSLARSGYDLEYRLDQALKLCLDSAQGKLDMDSIAKWLREHARSRYARSRS